MNNITNQSPYIRTSREFPEDLRQLTVEINKCYIDIASSINNRTIGLYSGRVASITGNAYYITNNQKQQSLRQVYTFTSTANIPHGIKFTDITQIAIMYGTYFNSTNNEYYGLIPGTSVAITGQISFYLTSTNIVFVVDGAAPALNSGIITLEWISET